MKSFKTVRAQRTSKLVERMKNQKYIAWNIHITRLKLIALLLIACNKINPRNPYLAYVVLHNQYIRLLAGGKRTVYLNKYLCAREVEALYNETLCPICKEKIDTMTKKLAIDFSQREADIELEQILKENEALIEKEAQRTHKRKIEREKLRLNQ